MENNINLCEKFEQFLLDNNIFSQFCSNILIKDSMLLYEYCEKTHPQYYISRAFAWSYTKEGYDFWLKVNIKWDRIYEENKLG